MSVKIEGNRISLTRGDTLTLQVSILVDGEAYAPVTGDEVRFALKRAKMDDARTAYIDRRPLIYKTIPNGTLILTLEPEDTKPLGFGTYDYDVQITFEDGTVDTFISDQLILTREVD